MTATTSSRTEGPRGQVLPRGKRAIIPSNHIKRACGALCPAGVTGMAACILTAALAGCGTNGAFDGRSPSSLDPASEPSPVVALKAAYELEGNRRPVVFVTADDLSDEEFADLLENLQAQISAQVLPAEFASQGDPDLPALTPIDPDTGDVGVSLILQAMTPLEEGRYQAVVSYARSGLEGGDLVLTITYQDGQWSVVQAVRGAQS